jgi:hypothetical protein
MLLAFAGITSAREMLAGDNRVGGLGGNSAAGAIALTPTAPSA